MTTNWSDVRSFLGANMNRPTHPQQIMHPPPPLSPLRNFLTILTQFSHDVDASGVFNSACLPSSAEDFSALLKIDAFRDERVNGVGFSYWSWTGASIVHCAIHWNNANEIEHNHYNRQLMPPRTLKRECLIKAGPPSCRGLIFLFGSYWKIWRMTPLLCACAVVITLETQKCRKRATHTVEFNFFLKFRKNRFPQNEEEGQIYKRLPQIFNFCLRT